MAIPADPTATTTVTYAMKEAGRYTVSSSEVGQMIAGGFQIVKTELWDANRNDDITATESMVVIASGTSTLTLPSDFDHEQELRFYWANDEWRGLIVASYSTAVQLPSSVNAGDEELTGQYLFLIGGSMAQQYRQITAYSGSTRWATVSTAFGGSLTADTYCQVGYFNYLLTNQNEMIHRYPVKFRPFFYEVVNQNTIRVWPPPDKHYPLLVKYIPNLTRLDEAGTTFIKHLRERMALWVQGIKVRTMARYDMDRYETEKQIYDNMLARYAGNNAKPVRTPFYGGR
jgi:hypothetical protein